MPAPRCFWLVLSGYAVSSYGNYLNLIALGLFSYQATGSSWATGAVMALRLGSGFLAGLVSDRVFGRIRRRPLLVGLDLVQAAAMVALVVAPSLVMLLAVAVVLGVGNTLLVVALRSGLPELVGPDERARANGRLVTARSLATVLGFGSAGVVIDLGGTDTAFLLNAGSFLVSAVVLSFVSWPDHRDASAKDAKVTRRATWRLLPAVVAGMVAVRGLDALASAAHNVALPIFATAEAPANPAALMAQFMTAWAIGSLGAHQLVGRIVTTVDHRVFAVATCVMSAAFVLAFTGLPAVALVAVALVAGIADGVSEIGYVSTLQTEPPERRTQVFGLSASVENLAFGIGMLLSAGLLDVVPTLPVVGGFHAFAVLGVLVFVLLSTRRTPDDGPAPDLDQSRPAAGADRG